MVDNLKLSYLYRNEFDKSLNFLTNFAQETVSSHEMFGKDPFWDMLSIGVLKAICLNSISKNNKLDIGKIYLMLNDEKQVITELAEFKEKFDNRGLDFYKYVVDITGNPLTSAIDILKESIEPIIPHKYTIYRGNDVWLRSLLGSYHDINSEIKVNENLHPQYTTTSEREYKKGYWLSLALYRILELYKNNPNIMNEHNEDFTMLCDAAEFNLRYLTSLPDKYSYIYIKFKTAEGTEDDCPLNFTSKINIPSSYKKVIPKFIQNNTYHYLNSCLSRMMNTKYHKLYNYKHSIPNRKLDTLNLIYDITSWDSLDSVAIEGHCVDTSYIGTYKTVECCEEDLYVRLYKSTIRSVFIKDYNSYHYDSFRITCTYKGCDVCMCFIEDKLKVSISAFEGFIEEAKVFFDNLSNFLEHRVVY